MRIAGLSHVGIAVPDLEAAVVVLVDRLGVSPGPILENAEQKVRLVQFDLGNARLELLAPLGGEGPVAAFLERNPKGGLHHVALATDDVDEAAETLRALGVGILGPVRPNVLGSRMTFLRPADLLGVLVEIEGP
jgi:methylmalonyl-CoA/ethylmalonyl-CoA epimerase